MIINIDHIGLSSNNLSKDGTHLTALGYEKVFEEMDLENMEIKRPYLQEFTPTHSLALYRKNDAFDIELLQHGELGDETGFIFPFNQKNNNELNENADLNTFIIHISEVEKSVVFFQALGFNFNGVVDGLARFTFTTLIEKTAYHVLLKETQTIAKYYMDTPGFNSIALVSTNVEKEQRKLQKKGYTTGEIGQITVNNRLLKVFFVTGQMWNKAYREKRDMAYPSEYVIRILKGKYPRLNLAKEAFKGANFLDMGCGDGRNITLAKECGFKPHGPE